jgi:hypothetical protein
VRETATKIAMTPKEKPVVSVPRAYNAGEVMLVVMPEISNGPANMQKTA